MKVLLRLKVYRVSDQMAAIDCWEGEAGADISEWRCYCVARLKEMIPAKDKRKTRHWCLGGTVQEVGYTVHTVLAVTQVKASFGDRDTRRGRQMTTDDQGGGGKRRLDPE